MKFYTLRESKTKGLSCIDFEHLNYYEPVDDKRRFGH